MPGAHVWGWDSVGAAWVRVEADSTGKLKLDPTSIFTDVPVDNESDKAPTSNWAWNHEADASAHHSKYTDVEARAAINNIFGADGKCDADIDFDGWNLSDMQSLYMRDYYGNPGLARWLYVGSTRTVRFWGKDNTPAFGETKIQLYDGALWQDVIKDDTFQTALALYLEENPTDGVVNKAPTSNWAFDHENDASAHHVKYTDAEAQAACNLDGDLYHSIPASAFMAFNPDTDQVSLTANGENIQADANDIAFAAPVNMPDGSWISAATVYGNAAAQAETWYLARVSLLTGVRTLMGTALIGTEDTTISLNRVDNSLNAYYLYTTTLDTNDVIYGARVKFTL